MLSWPRLLAGCVAALLTSAALWFLPAGGVAAACSPLPCSQVAVPMPHHLDFKSDHGGVTDRIGVGTGFTYVDPRAGGGGYEPSRLATGDGLLRITTGPGIAYLDANSLENSLAVGVPERARVFSVRTAIETPPRGGGPWEQGGIWIGIDQDNYLKLVVLSHPRRIGVEFLGEADGQSAFFQPGATFARRFVEVRHLENEKVGLVMRADVNAGTVAAFYSVDGGDLIHLATFVPPPGLLSGGAAVDPGLTGGRLAGLFASHRFGPAPLEYRFDLFDVACHNPGCPKSTPDPGPGAGPRRAPDGEPNPRRTVEDTGVAGSLRASLRHRRRVRISRLVARGLPVVLRCSEQCSMRARIRGTGRWGRAVGLPGLRAGIAVGSGKARRSSAGKVRTRLSIFPGMRRRLQRVVPAGLAIEAIVRSRDGHSVRLKRIVRVGR
jgi:hypothetical protein